MVWRGWLAGLMADTNCHTKIKYRNKTFSSSHLQTIILPNLEVGLLNLGFVLSRARQLTVKMSKSDIRKL